MRKRVVPRLALALLVSLGAFVFISAVQFARYGAFSMQVGAMTVSGRHYNGGLADAEAELYGPGGWTRLDGAALVSFGGIEFQLADGFVVIGAEGERLPAHPKYLRVSGYEAIFSLPFGMELSFESLLRDGAPEAGDLRISGCFPEGIAAVEVPFRLRRSATAAWDNAVGVLGITYDNARHSFSRHSRDLAENRLVLSARAPTVFYRAMTDAAVVSLSDFIVPGMEDASVFAAELSAWIDRSFEAWGANIAAADADKVIAFGSEALRRGLYPAAMSAVPASFGNDPGVGWESAVLQFDRGVGLWERAAREAAEAEERKAAHVGEFLARRDYGALFAESRLIEFFAARGRGEVIDGVVSSARGIDPSLITLAASAGALESYADHGRWRAGAENPFAPLAERARQVVVERLRQCGDTVLAFSPEGVADVELNLRIGAALREWGERAGEEEWAALGRSLVLSVLSFGDAAGCLPATLVSAAADGALTPSAERIGSASAFRALGENEFLPRAVATGAPGVWAWTTARSVSVTQTAAFMDIDVSFVAGQTHYVMLQGVRPFAQLQMHGANMPRNPSFESASVISGWDYFADTQTLVLKIQHRTNVERVRVQFTAPPPAQVAAAPPMPPVAPAQPPAQPAPQPPPPEPPPVAEPSPPLPPPPFRPWAPPPFAPVDDDD